MSTQDTTNVATLEQAAQASASASEAEKKKAAETYRRDNARKVIYQDVKTPVPIETLEGILANSVWESEQYMEQKRPLFEQGWVLYRDYNQNKFKDRVKGSDVFTYMDAFRSILRVFSRNVSFVASDDLPLSDDRANVLTHLFAYDWESANWAKTENDGGLARDLNGASMTLFNGWNSALLRPEVVSVPTESMLLDPAGGEAVDSHRWIGAAMEYPVVGVLRDPDFIRDAVVEAMRAGGGEKSAEQKGAEEARRQFSEESTPMRGGWAEQVNDPSFEMLQVYDVYLPLTDSKTGKTEKWLVTISQSGGWIVRVKRLAPVGDDQKRNPMLTRYPCVLHRFYSQMQNDPIGLSIVSMIADKHIVRATTMNRLLRIIRDNSQATQYVLNGNVSKAAMSNFRGTTVAITPNQNDREPDIRKYVQYQQPQDTRLQDADWMMGALKKDMEDMTGVNEIALGGSPPSGEKLGATELRQQNLSARMKSRISGALEDQMRFANIYYDECRRNYRGRSGIRKKEISVLVGETRNNYVISRRDFEGGVPAILAKSELVEREKDEQKMVVAQSMLPHIQALGDPALYARAQKRVFEFSGVYDDEEISDITKSDWVDDRIEDVINVLAAGVPVQVPSGIDVGRWLERCGKIPTPAGQQFYDDLLRIAQEQGIEMQNQMAGTENEAEVVGDGNPRQGTTRAGVGPDGFG